MAAPAAAESLEERLGPLAAVEGLAGDEALVVAAEIAGEAQAAPISAAVGQVIELVDVVAAAVEHDADAAACRLADAGADALAQAFIAGRFRLVGVGVQCRRSNSGRRRRGFPGVPKPSGPPMPLAHMAA